MREHSIDVNDDSEFHLMVAFTVDRLGISEYDLADGLGVSRPTVHCWKIGQNCAHPALRRTVQKGLRELVENNR
jgi:hypothetical protein